MHPETDHPIEAFRQSVERLTSIPGILETLAITLARADELPSLIAQSPDPGDLQWLKEEQTAIGHPMTLRIRQAQLENELRQGMANIGESLRTAIDAAKAMVITAAGGEDAARTMPFARRHLELLSRYRSPLPATYSTKLRLGLFTAAWWTMDVAMSSLDEIRFDARQSG